MQLYKLNLTTDQKFILDKTVSSIDTHNCTCMYTRERLRLHMNVQIRHPDFKVRLHTSYVNKSKRDQ